MGYQLNQKRNELKAKQAVLASIFEAAGPELDLSKVEELKSFENTVVKAAEIKRLNDELTAFGVEVESLVAVESIGEGLKGQAPASIPQSKGNQAPQGLGDMFVESAALKGWKGGQGPIASVKMDTKTLFETGAGWAPETTRSRPVLFSIQTMPNILDLIPKGTTTQVAIKYMEETTFTNNAAETAEGGTYGEAALALTERSSSVRKIGVWLPMTDEQLEDVAYARGYVNNRLTLMMNQRLGSEVLVGDGTPPNLEGLLDNSSVQTQAKGDDPVADAVYKAMTAIRVTGGAEPNAVVMHPNDWQGVRLLRTADGVYIWGSPSEAGIERIWGLPVIQTAQETENTALVGSFAQYCELVMKGGVDFQITNSHSTYFISGKQAIRADFRCAFPIYRPTAFCKVTGI